MEDLQKRAEWLLPGGSNAEMFCQNTQSLKGILTAWEAQDLNRFQRRCGQVCGVDDDDQVSSTGLIDCFSGGSIQQLRAILQGHLPVSVCDRVHIHRLDRNGTSDAIFGHRSDDSGSRDSYGRTVCSHDDFRTATSDHLYSSAIFIGWGAAVASIAIEFKLKNGIGTLLGSAIGAGSLVIAHYLARGEAIRLV